MSWWELGAALALKAYNGYSEGKKEAEERAQQEAQRARQLESQDKAQRELKVFFAGDCPLLIDSNVWMNQDNEHALQGFFDHVVAPNRKRVVMVGEQLEEIDRRRKSVRQGDPNPDASMAAARHAVRTIEKHVASGWMKVTEVKDKKASRDFDSYALNTLIAPTLARGAKIMLITDDTGFNIRVHSSLNSESKARCMMVKSEHLRAVFAPI